ncbi:MAG: GNAT family N-acetyltransferase [Desulfomonile tiedjei]|nr:GNAT family N-acetyltransferase [Desulfomonile tiedjei]
MPRACQYSRLTIPNEVPYADVAATYVEQVGRSFGFPPAALEDIGAAVSGVVSNTIKDAFEPSQQATIDISCERIPVGLKIVVKDMGLPFYPEEILPPDVSAVAPNMSGSQQALLRARKLMDEVSFHNLGPDGKETHLIKYLHNRTIEDYYQACELELYEPAAAGVRPVTRKVEFEIRGMQASDAVEISRCFYRAYGYSFVYRHIYYPERIIELNDSGDMISAVAVTPEGLIVGHAALIRHSDMSTVAEIGLAVVNPDFRGQGCLTRLTEYLTQKAKSHGFRALFVLAATNHTFSQQVIHRFGFQDCGLLVGLGPASISFKALTETLPQRETYVICFRYLEKPRTGELYAPRHHRRFVRKLYGNIGYEPEMATPKQKDLLVPSKDAVVTSQYYTPSGFGRIEIEGYGRGLLPQVQARLKELCLKQIEVIQLPCDLTNPLAYRLVEQFEELGFFFCGIWPESDTGDALILQYLNNVSIDYDRIKIASPLGKEMLDYVKSRDPNVV